MAEADVALPSINLEGVVVCKDHAPTLSTCVCVILVFALGVVRITSHSFQSHHEGQAVLRHDRRNSAVY